MIPLSYSIRSLARRPLTAAVTIIGLSVVVFVFAAVLMLSRGVVKTLASNGSPSNALVLRSGATSEAVSIITKDQLRLLSAAPEVATSQNGTPLIAGELVVVGSMARDADPTGPRINVGMRGISEQSLVVRPNVKVISGRAPSPGTSEVMIGKAVEGRYAQSRIGQSLTLARRTWPIVGVFEADGSGFESEIWGDAQQLMDAFNRTMYSAAVLRLKDPIALSVLTAKLAADPQLSATHVWREDRFFAEQSAQLRTFVMALGIFVAVIFAIAAALGAAVTMYAQVAARVREVGTLRAMGFARGTVLGVFLRESVCLSLLSGVVGTLGATALSWVTFSTVNQQTFTLITFHFNFGPPVAASALVFSLVMGLLGGFLPALNAARLSIVNAVRGGR